MIWATLTWRLGYWNRSKIRSAQKCYPCLRYVVSPMCPGRTLKNMVSAAGFEPATHALKGQHGTSPPISFYNIHAAGILLVCICLLSELRRFNPDAEPF